MAGIKNFKDAVMGNSINTDILNLDSAMAMYNSAYSNLSKMQKSYDYTQRYYADAATSAQAAANVFNAQEAAKQRDFTMAMSSSAHQREVRDLQAAGLNPVLSAGGSGAPMGSAAAASSNNALTGVFGNMATTALSAIQDMAKTQLNNSTTAVTNANAVNASVYGTNVGADVSKYVAKLQAQTNLSMNAATNAMNERIARIQSLTSQEVARIAGEYNLSASQVAAFANQYAAELAYDANIKNTKAGMRNTNVNNSTTMKVARMNNAQQQYGTDMNTLGNIAGSLISLLGGAFSPAPIHNTYNYVK